MLITCWLLISLAENQGVFRRVQFISIPSTISCLPWLHALHPAERRHSGSDHQGDGSERLDLRPQRVGISAHEH
jgi:hypothetical protein